MPLYEYKCESCGEQIEILQRVTDDPATTCDSCGGSLRKLISSPAIQFKGSGFYITDYAKNASSGDSAGKNGGEGKSEPAPEKKSKSPASKESTSSQSSGE